LIEGKAKTKVINAGEIAEELGNQKVMNVVLLGALIKSMNLTDIDWEAVIKSQVKEKFVDINIKAFKKGMDAV
jgi:indolepyruvate ferredoxin oxidoreductase beta subunit